MLMSKSRLEKFLYALYSLDSSDLPTPQSRIEELYNCLVTGAEVPTFKPISRVEKYLMAILGVYDADSLPNPLSRVEVLLYKLATGDDNLDDIETFLSQHEELLAGIIRNGGVGGNIDIEYVLHTLSTEFNTLYNTAEKPVKSAILKGQTLVNIVNNDNWVEGYASDPNNTLFIQNISVKKGQTYTVIGKIENSDIIISNGTPAFRICAGTTKDGISLLFVQDFNAVIKQTFTNNETDTIHLRFFNQKTNYKKLMIIEGDYTNVDIPYFEGMKSVENPAVTITGKNLFDVSRLPQTVNITPTSTGYTLTGYSCGINMRMSRMFPNLIVGKKYVFSFQSSSSSIISAQNSIGFYNMNTDELVYYRNNEPFTLTNEMYYERYVILYGVGNETVEFSNIQLEEGSVATEYEPYKSTTVSCNEDVELRGIGNIKDELDLVTGEVIQRVGEIVLDGSDDEDWANATSGDGWYRHYMMNNLFGTDLAISDKYVYLRYLNDTNNSSVVGKIALHGSVNGYLYVGTNLSLNDFKHSLYQNPITVQYALAEESVKTVDLSVVDQDGNNTKLKSFDDITYVTLSSEGPIPEAEMEVATKNEEVLDTMSLRMDDIYAAQTTLEETSNTQSENVDATMFATTEIYEELL